MKSGHLENFTFQHQCYKGANSILNKAEPVRNFLTAAHGWISVATIYCRNDFVFRCDTFIFIFDTPPNDVIKHGPKLNPSQRKRFLKFCTLKLVNYTMKEDKVSLNL